MDIEPTRSELDTIQNRVQQLRDNPDPADHDDYEDTIAEVARRQASAADRRRQERRLLAAVVDAPAADTRPDLGLLRELLTAVQDDPVAGLPWRLDSAQGGHEDGPDGTTDIGGIVADRDRTVYDHTGTAVGTEPAVNELGTLNPPLTEALAVAGVNALPWLLSEVDRLREAVGRVRRADRPMIEGLREAVARGEGYTATLCQPGARDLLALLDGLLAVSPPHRCLAVRQWQPPAKTE